MIGVLLTILKVLGIALLVILGIVLFLILFILLAPIIYESSGSAEKESIDVKAKITWLLGILKIKACITNDWIRLQAKVLCFKVFSKKIPWHYPLAPKEEEVPQESEATAENLAKPEETPNKPEEGSAKPEQTSEPEEDVKPAESEKPAESTGKPEATSKPDQPAKPKKEEKAEQKPAEKPKDKPEKKKDKKKKKSKKEDKPDSAAAAEADTEKTKSNPLNKIKEGWEKLQRKDVKKTIALVKRTVFKLLKHILPRKVRIHGLFGTGDPATTGKILGYFYSFYPVYNDHGDYELKGDFENKVLKGKYYLKGRILLMYLVGLALRLLFDKNIRKLIFHKEEKHGK